MYQDPNIAGSKQSTEGVVGAEGLTCGNLQAASLPGRDIRPRFEKEIIPIADNSYCAIGFGLSNCMMVAVDGGKVIIDATEGIEAAKEVKHHFDRIEPGPVLALIYTHSHADHILGSSVFGAHAIWASAKARQEIDAQVGIPAKALFA